MGHNASFSMTHLFCLLSVFAMVVSCNAVGIANEKTILSSKVGGGGDAGNKIPLQSAESVMNKLNGGHLRSNKNAMASAHRFKSTPLKDPNDPDDGAVFRGPPRGRTGAFEDPKTFRQWNTMGFLSDYYCTARVFDEPRRMRLSCTKNPKRIMNCFCADSKENEIKIPCRCEPGMTSKSKHINLIDKFVGT